MELLISMHPRSTVYLVTDSNELARDVRKLLESVSLPLERFPDPEEFLDYCTPSAPGCLISEVRLPKASGLDLQRRFIERNLPIPVIFVTAHADVGTAVRAMKEGAYDYLPIPIPSQTLLESVLGALQESLQMSHERLEQTATRRKLSTLTPRQSEVLDLVITGHPSKVIAQLLKRSKKTVDLHRAHLMRKMGASSVAELVRMVCTATVPSTSKVASTPDPSILSEER